MAWIVVGKARKVTIKKIDGSIFMIKSERESIRGPVIASFCPNPHHDPFHLAWFLSPEGIICMGLGSEKQAVKGSWNLTNIFQNICLDPNQYN